VAHLAVEQARSAAKLADGRCYSWIALRLVDAVAGEQSHRGGVATNGGWLALPELLRRPLQARGAREPRRGHPSQLLRRGSR
jgi:hypothetical protein